MTHLKNDSIVIEKRINAPVRRHIPALRTAQATLASGLGVVVLEPAGRATKFEGLSFDRSDRSDLADLVDHCFDDEIDASAARAREATETCARVAHFES